MKKDNHNYGIKINNGSKLVFAILTCIQLAPLFIFSICSLYFILTAFINTFKTKSEFFSNIVGLPKIWTLENIQKAWQLGKFGKYFANSIIITTCSTFLILFLCSLTAYGIARYKYKINTLLYEIFSFGLMFPVLSLTIPMYLAMRNLGLINTIPGIIVIYASVFIAFGVFVLTNYFKILPTEIYEAAKMDGAGEFTIFSIIMMPMAKPVLGTLGMIASINVWNDYFLSLIFIHNNQNKTLPMVTQEFFTRYNYDLPLSFAALFITTTPIIIAYIFGSKQIIRGLTEGAVK